ncbi:MAG TPA: tripartite tricarboxylate transporter TctB family protein [candidate division Zixibacteria bacterium]|nr:tripartite tricarboxylate transporter TctB family protein [candidate division Zixibacteria bacterium]
MKVDFTFFFLAVFLAAAFLGWDWPYIAKLMPVYVAAIPGLILVLVQVVHDATDPGLRDAATTAPEMDETHNVTVERSVELRRTLVFFSWFIGGALGIWLLGIVIALPALVFFYTLVEGRENWITCLLMAGCTYLLIWGLFEYLLESRWPPGLLFQ